MCDRIDMSTDQQRQGQRTQSISASAVVAGIREVQDKMGLERGNVHSLVWEA